MASSSKTEYIGRMRVIGISLAIGLLGALASRGWAQRLASQGSGADPHAYWFLGFAALLPGWLVALLALLGPAPVQRLRGLTEAAWILSAAAGLIGAIATEALVRRDWDAERRRHWWYGLASLVPAWLISLIGYLAR